MNLPKSINPEHIDSALSILTTKIKGIPANELRTINSNISDLVLDAMEFIKLTKSDKNQYTLTDLGRNYAQESNSKNKFEIFRKILKTIDIYNYTIENLHHSKKFNATKVDVGSYWNENFGDMVNELSEDDLLACVIFFFRTIERAGIGKFVAAGRGRETRVDLDQVELAKYITMQFSDDKKNENKIDLKIDETAIQKDSVSLPESLESKPNELSQGFELTNLRALKRINIELTWKELDSDGAKKLLIDKLAELSNQNTVLNAKVEQYQELDKEVAVLREKVNNLSRTNLLKSSVNSIGGIILGTSITFTDITYKIVGLIMGAGLILISLSLSEKFSFNKVKKEEISE